MKAWVKSLFVKAVTCFMHNAKERGSKIFFIVTRGEANIMGGEAGSERMDRAIETAVAIIKTN